MQLELRHNLPFLTLQLEHGGHRLDVGDVLIDTGSAGTVLSADAVEKIGITPRPEDTLRTLRGVGGTEVVYTRVIDRISVADASIENLRVEIGGMDCGFQIQGILGMEFLRRTGAVIDLGDLMIRFAR